jgi:hypothetical protein
VNKRGPWLLIEKKGEGRGGHEAPGSLSRGSHFVSGIDRRLPAGHARFESASFFPFSLASRLPPATDPASLHSHYWGYDSSLACGPMHFVLAPLNQKKKRIDKSGRNRRALRGPHKRE